MPALSTFGRPGVYLEERPLPRNVPPQGTTDAVGVIVGHAVSGPMGPAYIDSWREFVATYGGAQTDTPLSRSVYQAFSHGSGPLFVLRVVGAGSKPSVMSATDAPHFDFVFEATSPGAWGDQIIVSLTKESSPDPDSQAQLYTVQVSLVGHDYKEVFAGVSDDPNSPNYLQAVINDSGAGSRWVNVTSKVPSTGGKDLELTAHSLQDGTVTLSIDVPNANQVTARLQNGLSISPRASDYADVLPTLDELKGALLLYIADASYIDSKGGGAVNIAATHYAETRGDSFAVLDAPVGLSVMDVLAYGQTTSSYGALYYPQVRVQNPAQDAAAGSTLLVPPGAALVGLILAKDRIDGPWSTPAGPSLSLPTAASSRFLGVEKLLTNQELDDLNTGGSAGVYGSPVNAIRPMVNSGITVMGARTRLVDSVARYVNVRRTLNYLKVELQDRATFALFEPITGDVMSELQVVLSAFLTDVWQDGGLAGSDINDAFYVVCDDTNNTVDSIARGLLYIDVGLALLVPAEYIVVRVGQFEGGTSASEIDVVR